MVIFSAVNVPPQDLHFRVSMFTPPGRSTFSVTLVVGASGFLRAAKKMMTNPATMRINPTKSQELLPLGQSPQSSSTHQKGSKIPAPIYATTFIKPPINLSLII